MIINGHTHGMKRPLPRPLNTVDLRKPWGTLKCALLNWWAIPGWSANFSLQKSLTSTVLPRPLS